MWHLGWEIPPAIAMVGFSRRRHQVGISRAISQIFATGVISLGPLGALVLSFFFGHKGASCWSKANSLNHRVTYLLLVSSASFIYLFRLYSCFIYLFINGTSNVFYWDPNENWHDTHSKLTHHLQAKVRMFPSLEVVSLSWPFLTNLHSVLRWIPRDFPWQISKTLAPAAGTAGPSRGAPRTWWWWRYDH